jgi:FtsH-binding integral membrane protein
MKTTNKAIIGMAITVALLVNFFLLSVSIRQGPVPAKNVVLVHGAFVNGACWKPVYDFSNQAIIVQRPLAASTDDINAVKRTLSLQADPVF